MSSNHNHRHPHPKVCVLSLSGSTDDDSPPSNICITCVPTSTAATAAMATLPLPRGATQEFKGKECVTPTPTHHNPRYISSPPVVACSSSAVGAITSPLSADDEVEDYDDIIRQDSPTIAQHVSCVGNSMFTKVYPESGSNSGGGVSGSMNKFLSISDNQPNSHAPHSASTNTTVDGSSSIIITAAAMVATCSIQSDSCCSESHNHIQEQLPSPPVSLFTIVIPPTCPQQSSTQDCGDCEGIYGDHSQSDMSVSYTSMSVQCSGDAPYPTLTPTDRHPPHREREVSSMDSRSGSSTGRSRSGLRLAKKERRQKAKDGNEGAEAFAGDDGSCEDEGMTEIVVNSPKKPEAANNQEMSDSAWATPMLSSTTSIPTPTNKRADLRRGKRDLMRSWLDTPLSTADVGPPTASPHASPNRTSVPQRHEASPVFGSVTSVSLTGVLMGIDSHHCSPITSMSLDDAVSPTSSSMSVRHSRPRDAIRSIHAMRGSSSTNVEVDGSNSSSYLTSLSLPEMAVCESGPTQLSLMSCGGEPRGLLSPSFASTFTTISGSKQQKQLGSHSSVFRFRTMGSEVTTHGCFDNMNPAISQPLSTQLSLHPGPKPRNVVTFNADAYNLDAWDADVMGLFALPTEGVTNLTASLKTRGSLSQQGAVDMSTFNGVDNPQLLSGDMWDSESVAYSPKSSSPPSSFYGFGNNTNNNSNSQQVSSFSVLSAYFDQSRPSYNTSCEAYQDPLMCRGEVVDAMNNGNHLHTSNQFLAASTLQYVVSPSNGDNLLSGSSSSQKSDINSSSRVTSTGGEFNKSSGTCKTNYQQQVDVEEHLIEVGVAHVKASSPSILLLAHDPSCCIGSNCPHLPHAKRGASSRRQSDFIAGVGELSIKSTRNSVTSKVVAFSGVVSKFVTVDTLVHKATSYTEQLANPTSGTGLKNFRREHDRWLSAPN